MLALCCFAGRGMILYAQSNDPYDESIPDDDEDGSQADSDFDKFIPDIYTNGDQAINISLGAVFPTVFLNNGKEIAHNIIPPVGGMLSFAYNYFLGANIFLGGEVGFAYAYTLGENALFIIPIGFRAGWQFVFRRFEFPLYAAIGIAPQRYLDLGYFGMYLKGALSGFYRFHPKWSFGLIVDWTWYPQWPMKDNVRITSKDVDGNMLGVILSARYHF